MTTSEPLHLFAGYGIEIEYMIVDKTTLDVRPIADQLLYSATGDWLADHVDGEIGWSNELVLHLVELKTMTPVPELGPAAEAFAASARRLNALLAPMNARLMPTGAHPWMNPKRDTRLWPHECAEIYREYHRIFDCHRHGWANVQSTHINLPFADDTEFGRLHAAARLALPLIPALTASSPLREGARPGALDGRLLAYQTNAQKVPQVTGATIPEPVFTIAAYEDLLQGVYRAIAPHNPDGSLQYEWLNARGAIARFDRYAIEIRLVDAQECPRADVAVSAAVSAVVEGLVQGRWLDLRAQQQWPTEDLAAILQQTIRDGPAASLTSKYAAAFGYTGTRCTGRDLWSHVLTHGPKFRGDATELHRALDVILRHGTLAERILRDLGDAPSRAKLRRTFERLCDGLDANQSFLPA